MQLFEDDWGEDESPLDSTEITTTILYFSAAQLERFKTLSKIGIKKMFEQDYHQRGNLPIFLLNILEQQYGTNNSTPKVQESSASTTGGWSEGDFPF